MDNDKDEDPARSKTYNIGVPSALAQDEEVGLLSSPIRQLSSELAGEGIHSAPVQLPNREDLTVRLVNISLLQRLDELRGDVALLQTIFWTIVGALLGLITTLFVSLQTITQIDKAAQTMLVLLSLFIIIFSFLWQRAAKRANKLRDKIFTGQIVEKKP